MNVKDIVAKYLKQNGYDGIYYPGECACKIDDLAPCGESLLECIPGYEKPCDCGEHEWHIEGWGEKCPM